MRAMSLEIIAMLTKVIFTSERTQFVVAEFIDCQSAKRFRASGEALRTGKTEGQQRYRLFGDWKMTPKYGETFVISYAEPLKPQSLAGLASFLANNVKGVGEKTAAKFVQTLAPTSMERLLGICEKEPERIYEFFGKRRELAEDVMLALVGDDVYRSMMMFLHENNISSHFAKKIYEKYGAESMKLLQENPYRLIRDFRNVGFKKADLIAQKLGVAGNSRFRIEACFLHVLERALDDGHCCLPRDLLIERAREALGARQNTQDADRALPSESLSFEWLLAELRELYKIGRETGSESFKVRSLPPGEKGHTKNEMLFYLPQILEMEDRVSHYCAERLWRRRLGQEHQELFISKNIHALAELIPDIPWQSLSDEQLDAVHSSASENFMILTGGPGCGKTFVLKAIFRLQKKLKRSVALCAPTGLAAKRMTQSIGAQACTLHKLLGMGKPAEGVPSPSDSSSSEIKIDMVDTVICDESSMLSLDLLLALLEAMGPDKRLILVGDVDQLPSVGAGQCLKDLIHSKKIHVSRLTKIFRQAGSSPIPVAARQIITGELPQFDHSGRSHLLPGRKDFAFIASKAEQFFEVLTPFLQETVQACYDLDPVRDVQILVPMRKSIVGQDEINRRLQEVLNPKTASKNECSLKQGLFLLREGDKVIQTRNNYERDVFNGDLGYVQVIRAPTAENQQLEVDVLFQDRIVRLEGEEVDDLQLCYAMTIHKSQGSEFPLCIIPMYQAYYSMLYRNLFYTAVTRASRTVVVIGEEWALKRAVRNTDASNRYTALRFLIENAPERKLVRSVNISAEALN